MKGSQAQDVGTHLHQDDVRAGLGLLGDDGVAAASPGLAPAWSVG